MAENQVKMSRIIPILLIVLTVFPSCSQVFKINNLDKGKGFTTPKPGDKKQNIKNLIPIESGHENYEWYIIANENVSFQGITLNNVRYGFFNDKVFQIDAIINSFEFEPLVVALDNLYGPHKTLYVDDELKTKLPLAWSGRKNRLILSRRSGRLSLSLLDAEKRKRRAYRKKNKEQSKEHWDAEYFRSIKRSIKREYRKENRIQKKADKEYLRYLKYQRKHNYL